MVAGAVLDPADSVMASASRAPNLTTFVHAIQTAGLEPRLNTAGPFTLFAPDNAAFDKISAQEREALMQPENRERLAALLNAHIVPGRLTAAEIALRAQANGGVATFPTAGGGEVSIRDAGAGRWMVTAGGETPSTVTQADILQANGVVHVIDTVLRPG